MKVFLNLFLCTVNVNNCSIRWIVKILKKTKKTETKMLSFYKQQLYSSQIASKKQNNNIILYEKFQKKNNITLGFSFIYLVSVYPTNRINVSLS